MVAPPPPPLAPHRAGGRRRGPRPQGRQHRPLPRGHAAATASVSTLPPLTRVCARAWSNVPANAQEGVGELTITAASLGSWDAGGHNGGGRGGGAGSQVTYLTMRVRLPL